MATHMEDYYRARAAEYDEFYEIPERQDDLARLKTWLVERARDRSILEVAAGTGHWTEAAAQVAKAITATDYNWETLAFAARRSLGPHVTLITADAYALPEFASTFDIGMAHLWWSHVGKQRRHEFLSHFVSRLQPGASILMIDQIFVEDLCRPISGVDEWGNLLALRKLKSGAFYEIIKNYPTSEELQNSFAPFSDNIEIMLLDHFWALSARVRQQTG
jgi:demethylmenaquinone methyltransferase/2-methoxy-6-polyprenyl-1,4-benzoquinol methylase